MDKKKPTKKSKDVQETEVVEVEATSTERSPEEKTSSNTREYFRKGMEDAAKKAEEYAPKFKKEVESLLGEVAYGAGFIPGFLGTIVNEFVPENVKSSMQDGMAKGEEKAKSVAEKMRDATTSKSEDSKYAPSEGVWRQERVIKI